MGREDKVISLADYRMRKAQQSPSAEGPSGMQLITEVRREARKRLTAATERLSKIDEDAYASRNEARARLTFLVNFNRAIANVAPGASVDLTKTVIDRGYDYEEAAEAHESGLVYIPAADRAEAEYTQNM